MCFLFYLFTSITFYVIIVHFRPVFFWSHCIYTQILIHLNIQTRAHTHIQYDPKKGILIFKMLEVFRELRYFKFVCFIRRRIIQLYLQALMKIHRHFITINS